MRLLVIGSGQGGSMVAQEIFLVAQEVWADRHLRIVAGRKENRREREKGDPLTHGVLAINSASTDLGKLQYIPADDMNRLLLGSTTGHGGHGAGKDNLVGADLARGDEQIIMDTIIESKRLTQCEAVLVIGSTGGGTGSGSIGLIVNYLKQSSTKPVYAMLLLPFEAECRDPKTVENTARCLDKVLRDKGNEEFKADAVFLVDNQSFVRRNREASHNYQLINREIALALRDIMAASEETDPRFISEETIDAQDVIRTLQGSGVTVLGRSHRDLPGKPRISLRRHYLTHADRIERGRELLVDAFENLSADCIFESKKGQNFYSAGQALCLFSAPEEETTLGMIEVVEEFFAERVPGAELRRGTYTGRVSRAMGFTVVLSGIGEGEAMKTVASFLERGAEAQRDRETTYAERAEKWSSTMESSDNLRDRI